MVAFVSLFGLYLHWIPPKAEFERKIRVKEGLCGR
jgi:hypothetical protein